MSEVKHRTVYAENVKTPSSPGGVIRFLDWAVVALNTNDPSLSRMVEPFMVNNRFLNGAGISENDPTDPVSRIDEIEFIDQNKLPQYLSGGTGEPRLNGGVLTPQLGRGDLIS